MSHDQSHYSNSTGVFFRNFKDILRPSTLLSTFISKGPGFEVALNPQLHSRPSTSTLDPRILCTSSHFVYFFIILFTLAYKNKKMSRVQSQAHPKSSPELFQSSVHNMPLLCTIIIVLMVCIYVMAAVLEVQHKEIYMLLITGTTEQGGPGGLGPPNNFPAID